VNVVEVPVVLVGDVLVGVVDVIVVVVVVGVVVVVVEVVDVEVVLPVVDVPVVVVPVVVVVVGVVLVPVVVVVVEVVVCVQQSYTGHSAPPFLTFLTKIWLVPGGQESLHTHSNTGQPSFLSAPTHFSSWHGSSHTGVGRGLQIVDLQPHESVVSTIISHGRHTATLIAGHSRSTHVFSHGQQHSRPSRRETVFSTWHLLQPGSSILGQLASFSVQHLHGRH
jgi:hypothetical protein